MSSISPATCGRTPVEAKSLSMPARIPLSKLGNSSGTHTFGFAGFFGFPVAHQPADACKPAPRCPVLLVPPIVSREPAPPHAAGHMAEKGAWKAFQNSANSSITSGST